jgi:predicted ATPase
VGGFDLDAAQAIGGSGNVERFQVLDQLTLLVDKSLVVAESSSGRTRYRLLETVRQYVLEKLGESGEADVVRSRHRDHYTSKAAQLDVPATNGHEQRIEQAETEIDNLRAAFGWSRENSDVELALRLASSLQPLWLTRGHITEGLAWLDAALGQEPADHADVRPARGRALADKATLLASVGVTECVDEAEHAVTIARDLDDRALLVRALMARGSISADDIAVSRPYLDEAADLAREIGDSWWLSQILNWQAIVALQAGDMVATGVASEEALELSESVGDRFVSCASRIWLANARTYRGDLTGAVALFGEVVDETTTAHNALLQVHALVGQSYAMAMQRGGRCRLPGRRRCRRGVGGE